MAEDRASKRRKLGSESESLHAHEEQPAAARTPGKLPSKSKDSPITPRNIRNGGKGTTASAAKQKERSWQSDAAATAEAPATASGGAATNGLDHDVVREEAMDVELSRQSTRPGRRSLALSNGNINGAVTNGGLAVDDRADVDMEEAPSIAAGSQTENAETDAPRTSGRKRQISRKLEEAQSNITVNTRSSPLTGKGRRGSTQKTPQTMKDNDNITIAQNGSNTPTPKPRLARKTPIRKTPSKAAQSSETTLSQEPTGEVVPPSSDNMPSKPVRRRGRPYAASKRARDEEIPDSEPENEVPQTNNQINGTVASGNGPETVSEVQAQAPGVQNEQRPQVESHLSTPVPILGPQTPKKTSTFANAHDQAIRNIDLTTPQASKGTELVFNGTPIVPLIQPSTSLPLGDPNVALEELPPFEVEDLQQIQTLLMQKLTRRAPQSLVDVDNEIKKVANLVEQTITAGESNSMVLIGARGSGKTTMVDSILDHQRFLHGDDFHVVRLSGFIHTDDRIAIREIWRQLGREMDIEEDSQVKNYADTLTTLLALLSHPSETGQAQDGRMAKSVVIILDEFDLFTTHPRQTLLYNLFDIAQSRKAPIAVLGLTTRFDVAEALEKRVKSRFSHRQVYLPLARNFASYKDMCKSCLTIVDSGISDAQSLSQRWSSFLAAVFETSTSLNAHLQSLYHTTKFVPAFQTSMLLVIGTLRTDTALAASAILSHIESSLALAPSLAPPDSNLSLLPSLSSLELGLLICAARLLIIHDAESCSFPLAYDEYKSLASKARIAASAMGALATGSGSRVWGVGVARLAWEGLVDKGLVVPVSDRARGGGGVCRVDVSLEEIGLCADASLVDVAGMARWCKEI